jgi:nucleoside-diphosphate-sugar epimerase
MPLKQKISVLGCGWLGMPLAFAFVRQGYSVKGSDTSGKKSDQLREGGVLPYFIHLNKAKNEISGFLESEVLILCVTSKNVDDFKNLIHQIEKSPVKKVLFVSSTSVYPTTNGIVTETSTVTDSALTEIESLFRSNRHFKTTIVRFGGLFGYDRKPGRFFPSGKKIDHPEGFVNFIHRDDCIGIISQILEKNVWQETLNACADTHPTRRAFYTNEVLKLGLKEPEFNEYSLNEFKIVNSDKIKELLGYTFKHPDLLNHTEE